MNTGNDILFEEDPLSTFKNLLKFELKSIIGNHLINFKPPKTKMNYLEVGAESRLSPEWCGLNFYTIRFWKAPKNVWMQDLRKKLNCQDNYFDGIFSEHTIEHLTPRQAVRLLRELYRILKPGKYIRITAPDLKKYVDFYTGALEDDAKFKETYSHPAIGIRNMTQNYLHLSAWDASLLGQMLKEIGFVDIEEKKFGESRDTNLVKESEHRRWETFYIEAKKGV